MAYFDSLVKRPPGGIYWYKQKTEKVSCTIRVCSKIWITSLVVTIAYILSLIDGKSAPCKIFF